MVGVGLLDDQVCVTLVGHEEVQGCYFYEPVFGRYYFCYCRCLYTDFFKSGFGETVITVLFLRYFIYLRYSRLMSEATSSQELLLLQNLCRL